MAMEAEHRNCTNIDQQNREDDREKRKVKKTVFHYTKSVVFFLVFYCSAPTASPGAHTPVGPWNAYNVGVWCGIRL